MSDSENTTTWVTVAEAADKAQVDSGTVRQWYRAGRLPTRRSEGERGAFLVPLDLVLSLVNPPDAPDLTSVPGMPSIEDALRELGIDDRSAELTAIEQGLATASAELADAREQLEFLRSQLSEASGESRTLKLQLQEAEDQRAELRSQLSDAIDDRKGVEVRLATVEAELTQLRRTAARSSITDNSWLDQETPAYESPVRRQAMANPRVADVPATPPDDGPTAPFLDDQASELAGLLAATRPDDEDGGDPATGSGPTGRGGLDAEDEAFEERAASRVIWTDEVPHPPLGESPDDLLPDHDRRGRFGKK